MDEFFDRSPECVDVVIEASGDLNNVTRLFRRINANGRIAFLARSGMPLVLDAVDHMITNAVSMTGSRGHLCGAFSDILNLYKKGRIPLEEIVTDVIDGPDELCSLLKNTDSILNDNCKVLVRFGENPQVC